MGESKNIGNWVWDDSLNNGNGGWVQQKGTAGGAGHAIDPPLEYVTYAGGGFTYYCSAVPGTALATEAWQVARKRDASGTISYAGTGLFAHAANSLAVVANLSYTL